MASEEPQKGSVGRQRLPFEPIKHRKKAEEEQAAAPKAGVPKSSKADQPLAKPVKPSEAKVARATSASKSSVKDNADLPQVVSQRMAQRMAVFSGIPTALGMSVFLGSYWVVTHGWMKLPNVAVLLMSMGFFGLGVLGLSYGVISASWDEAEAGSKLGWTEFKVNLGRMTEAWRASRHQKSS